MYREWNFDQNSLSVFSSSMLYSTESAKHHLICEQTLFSKKLQARSIIPSDFSFKARSSSCWTNRSSILILYIKKFSFLSSFSKSIFNPQLMISQIRTTNNTNLFEKKYLWQKNLANLKIFNSNLQLLTSLTFSILNLALIPFVVQYPECGDLRIPANHTQRRLHQDFAWEESVPLLTLLRGGS